MEENVNFSDTLVALRMMCAQFPHIEKSLRRERVIRTFKLSTGQDDHAILFLDDYISQIERVSKRLEAQKEDISVFGWFKEHVIHSKLDPSIGHEELGMALTVAIKA